MTANLSKYASSCGGSLKLIGGCSNCRRKTEAMARLTDLAPDFRRPHRNGCPYLEGLPAGWLWQRYPSVDGTQRLRG